MTPIKTSSASHAGIMHDGSPICNFDLAVTQTYLWADGPLAGELACVIVRLTSDFACYHEQVPACELDRLSFLKKHPDLSLYHRKFQPVLLQHLSRLLSSALAKGPSGLVFCQTGLHHLDSAQTVFVAGDRLIGGNEIDAIFTPEIAQFHLPPSPFPPKEAARLLLTRLCRTQNSASVPIFAFGLLTAVQSLILSCGIPLTSVLYVSGGSGLGKTESVKRFFALYDFAATGQPALITEAGSTMAGFRKHLRIARDLPVVLDDLCLSTGQSFQRRRVDLGAQVVREAANKSSVRVSANTSAQEACTAAGVALTAEFTLSTISDLTRCIIIPLTQPVTGGQADDRSIAAGALDSFLNWFVSRSSQEAQTLRRLYDASLEQRRMDRLDIGLFCMRWVFQRFLTFSLDVGALTQEEHHEFQLYFQNMLDYIESQQRALIHALDTKIPKLSIPELLLEGLKHGYLHVTSKRKKWDESAAFRKGNDLLIPPTLLLAFVNAQDGYQTFTLNKLGRALKAAGVLVLHKGDHANTVKIRDNLPRMYHVRIDLLEEVCRHPVPLDQ